MAQCSHYESTMKTFLHVKGTHVHTHCIVQCVDECPPSYRDGHPVWNTVPGIFLSKLVGAAELNQNLGQLTNFIVYVFTPAIGNVVGLKGMDINPFNPKPIKLHWLAVLYMYFEIILYCNSPAREILYEWGQVSQVQWFGGRYIVVGVWLLLSQNSQGVRGKCY